LPEAVPDAWRHLRFFQTDWPQIASAINADPSTVLPPEGQRFTALNLTPPDRVRVVILGQDPYPTPGHAHGLAFSVTPETRPLPRSLSNIFKEMESDLGKFPANGDLRPWAKQGVLLLNSCLTVPSGDAGGHARLGWQKLAAEALAETSARPCAFVLWGAHAQSLGHHICAGDHLIIKTAHPSPLSARRGFFGSRPFSRINDWLGARGACPINWA
jgi:uracil-DNA glycosylase